MVKGEALLQLRQFLDNVKANPLELGSSSKKMQLGFEFLPKQVWPSLDFRNFWSIFFKLNFLKLFCTFVSKTAFLSSLFTCRTNNFRDIIILKQEKQRRFFDSFGMFLKGIYIDFPRFSWVLTFFDDFFLFCLNAIFCFNFLF